MVGDNWLTFSCSGAVHCRYSSRQIKVYKFSPLGKQGINRGAAVKSSNVQVVSADYCLTSVGNKESSAARPAVTGASNMHSLYAKAVTSRALAGPRALK